MSRHLHLEVTNKKSQTNSRESGRERFFTVLAVLLPLLFFVLLEGGLRLAGYGDDYPLFLPINGFTDYLYTSRDVANRYFSQQESVPSIPFDSFTRVKGESTIRVFVQGGSSAAGYPFYFSGGFSDMLEQRLLQSYPGRNVEVVNTSMAAVNSYTLLDLADEIIEQQPDAILIYAGHNEYYGALGVGSAESIGRWRPSVMLYLSLKKLRTVQALREMVAGIFRLVGDRERGEAPGSTLMARMVGDKSIPYGSATFDAGIEQFRANMSDLLAKYRRQNIPVFIGTLVSNARDHRPFVSGLSDQTDQASWQEAFEVAIRTASAGDTVTALARLDDLIAADDLSGDAYFARAKLLDGLGRLLDAKSSYYAAKDRDDLRFRAPEAINVVVREVAEEYDAVVVEIQSAFEAASPSGVPGADLMADHLHPNATGFFEIASAFYDAIVEARVFGPRGYPIGKNLARTQMLFTELDSLVGVYRVQLLKASWPFQPIGAPAVPVELSPATFPESLAVQVFRKKITRLDGLDKLRAYYLARRDGPNALRATLATIQRYPFLASPFIGAADILVEQGALDQALTYYEAANDRQETAQAYRMIGGILLRQNKREEAIPNLELSLELEPDNPQALYNLAGAYALTTDYDKSRETVTRLLELRPNHADGKRLLASLP